MAIEAAFSKYKKTNYKLMIAICIGLAIYCTYDGYLNDDFIAKHTNSEGQIDSKLVFNKRAPYVLTPLALVALVLFYVVKDKKIIAADNDLVLSCAEKIPYDSIEEINKANYSTKGYFTISYKDSGGQLVSKKISDRKWDNLSEVLDLLVSKLTEGTEGDVQS